ncbi:MAG: hypothetical protein FWG27_03340 [Treponema sp.]|nr:hypothetical protein [Treponema sp.]
MGIDNMENENFLMRLSQYLFWDCNIAMLNPNVDKKIVLERIFQKELKKMKRKFSDFMIKKQ